MEVKEVLRMNERGGRTSYAKNSTLQEKVILKKWHIVEDAILDLYCSNFLESFAIADLGCSSGPNTMLLITKIIDIVDKKCHLLHRSAPEFRVFLNDLPGNDFNSVFRSLPSFYEKRSKEKGGEFGSCYIAAVPRSFYGQAFPSKSLHFAHSNYALHWLSQTPLGLESEEGVPLNKGQIYICKTSPSCVMEAYLNQFQKDFSLFLKSRAAELVDGGRIVLTLMGRISPDPWARESGYTWVLLGKTLNDMVSKGLIEEDKLDSFNLPFYAPSSKELENEIEKEGSFIVDRMEVFKLNFDKNDPNSDYKGRSGERAAKILRAVSESMLSRHFGEEIMDDLFKRFQVVYDDQLGQGQIIFTNIVLSMIKKV